MAATQQNITAAINIDVDIMSQVMTKLSEIGVTCVDDLQEVTIEDIIWHPLSKTSKKTYKTMVNSSDRASYPVAQS